MSELRILRGATVHTGDGVRRDVAVVLEADRIAALVPEAEARDVRGHVLELDGAHLAPGFVDLQVNGGGGVMLNDEPTVDGVERIARAHRAFGTTALLPTFITGSREGMAAAAAAVRDARRLVPGTGGSARVLGVHFEGPFLDARRPGAHDVAFLRPPCPEDLAVVTGAREEGAVVLLTLAARHLDARTAAALAGAGVRVSLGHCAATYAEATAALARGATLVTHLFNAMSPLTSREGGLVGAALDAAAEGRARAGLILDGVHVAFEVARVAVRAAGPGGVFLVTDAVAPVGADGAAPGGAGGFLLGGQRVRVEDGRCVNEAGALAGSALDMATAVRHAVRHLALDLDEALRMASTYPAAAAGLAGELGRLAPGHAADLVWLDEDLRVLGTLVGGR